MIDTSRQTRAALFAIVLFLLPFSAKAAIPVNENFNGSFNDPAWQMYGSTTLDTNWLRLTPAAGNQQGAAILLDAFPSSTQMVITFDYAMYGGTGADGLVFFLQDGAEGNVGPGDYGGCLGYCSRAVAVQNPRIPGVRSAWVGVAFDEYGNMSDPAHSPTGGPGVRANHVLIKGQGPADGLTGGYQYLTGVTPAWDLQTGSRAGAYTIRILIINNVVTVQRLIAGTFTTFLTQDLSAAGQSLPPTLRLGFTAGTGGSTNIHEIDNLRVDFPTDLVLAKTGSANAAAGGPISYTITMTNSGPYAANGAVITDTIPASITGVTWTCAASGGAVCVTGNGVGNALSETANIPVGGQITMTVAGTVNPTTTIGTVISNTATVVLPNGLADINATDNTSAFNTTVNGAAVSITATTNGAEPATPGLFTVSIAQAVPQAVTVNYTITGTATAGTDYTALTGSVVIPANTLSVPLNVLVLDDVTLEVAETVIATLNTLSSAFVGTLVVAAAPNNAATINILDNEKIVSIAATDALGDVAGGTGTVVVTVLDSSSVPVAGVVVSLAVNGSATLSSYLGVTDVNGQVIVLVSDTVIELVDVTASYDSDGDNTADLAVVTGSPAVVTFTAGPGGAGPIHAWHLEDLTWPAANSAIDYIGAWEGTPTDGPTNIGPSPALTAIGGQGTCNYGVFDGANDNIEIGQPAADITTSLTLTAWVRASSTSAGLHYAIARGHYNPPGPGNDREIYLGRNGATFSAGSRGNAAGTQVTVTAGAVPAATIWTHIAATATITSPTEATWRLYVNGGLVGTTVAASWPVVSANAYWSIGGRSDNNGDNTSQWNGNIDEVKMYDYALTAAQIAAVMGERHACPGPNLSVIKSVSVIDDVFSVANDKAIPGATMRYTITLQNTSGAYSSDAVVITDNFNDTNLTYVPGSVSTSSGTATVSDAGGVPAKSDRIVVTPASIPAGGSVTVTFDVVVD